MIVVAICKEFGWTYQEYCEQPQPFIDLIKEKMKVDAQVAQKELKKK